MSTDPHASDDAPDAAAARDVQDFVLQLDFVPTWARKPSDNPYGSSNAPVFREERSGRPDRRGGDRRPMGGAGGGGGAGRGGPGKGPGGQRAPSRGGPRDMRDGRGKPERRAFVPSPRIFLPLDISFIPERQQLSAVVRQLHATQKAFPLAYLAGLFLARSEGHLIKVEVKNARDGQPGPKLIRPVISQAAPPRNQRSSGRCAEASS